MVLWVFFFCLIGCFSMIVWTPTVFESLICMRFLSLHFPSNNHVLPVELSSWLPVKARIQYKIACLCFQCIYQNSMTPYISDFLHLCCPSRTLRSLDTSFLTVPHFSLATFGKRSFSVFGPTVWNSLPLSLRKNTVFYYF